MSLEQVAARLSAVDVFVLHRVGQDRFVNIDGVGRGAGWAGNIDVAPASEPWLTRVHEDGLLRTRYPMPHRVFGPYWSAETAGVSLGDHLVVFGGQGVATTDDQELVGAARSAVAMVEEVPVAKRLADELEVTQAALEIAQMRHGDLAEAASAIATAAARATSCEFGAVLLYGPPVSLHLAAEGWRPSATDDEIITALMPLAQAITGGLLVEQDTASSAFPYRPLAFQDGLVARCAVPLGEDGGLGALVVAHSIESPRGFTMLCQRVMKTVADAAVPVLGELVSSP